MRITARSPDPIPPSRRSTATHRAIKKQAMPGERRLTAGSERVAAVNPDRARLVGEVADARVATTLVVERQTRGLIPEVVDVRRQLPAIGLQSEAQVAERVTRQLGVEAERRYRKRSAELVQLTGIRVARAGRGVSGLANRSTDLAEPRFLVLELRECGTEVLHGEVG